MFTNWHQTWQLGIKSMLLHPLRSGLTVLGIFIGVASVIWLMAIGEGIGQQAQQQIANLGADNIIVRSIKPPEESFGERFGPMNYGLTRADLLRMGGTLPSVRRALPIRELRRKFTYGPRQVDGRLVGCTPDYADVTKLEIDRGHFITDAELRDEKNHCVLAAETAERLFPYEDPIGQSIAVESEFFLVVGVVKPKAPSAGVGGSLEAQDYAQDVYIPITTLWRRIGDFVITMRAGSFEGEVVELSQVTLRVDDTDNVLSTADLVDDTLSRHHLVKDYGVTVPLELLEQARTTRLMFILFIGLIAGISLVVGGIGIMNIMLATVTERTREIGIRRALGAKRRDITGQFLAETIVLSTVGGLLGIAGGLFCGPATAGLRELAGALFPDAMQALPELIQTAKPILVPWSIPLAFSISVAVGVIFGLYPAIRAAHMDPIDALRHE